jgi:hypothetical protein
VMHRGRCQGSGADFAVGGQHLANGAKAAAAELACHGIRTTQVGIDNSDQANGLTLLFEFLVNAGMIPSENAYAHDRDRNLFLRWQKKFSMAGCRRGL